MHDLPTSLGSFANQNLRRETYCSTVICRVVINLLNESARVILRNDLMLDEPMYLSFSRFHDVL